jgi:hypothetical protein
MANHVAGFVISAASLAIQFGEIGVEIINSRKAWLTESESDIDIQGLELAVRHECEQTQLLSTLIMKRKFGLTGTTFELMRHHDQEILFAILDQLFRIWTDVNELRKKDRKIPNSPMPRGQKQEIGTSKELLPRYASSVWQQISIVSDLCFERQPNGMIDWSEGCEH